MINVLIPCVVLALWRVQPAELGFRKGCRCWAAAPYLVVLALTVLPAVAFGETAIIRMAAPEGAIQSMIPLGGCLTAARRFHQESNCAKLGYLSLFILMRSARKLWKMHALSIASKLS